MNHATNFRRRVKSALVKAFGGKCCRCNYDKCEAALELLTVVNGTLNTIKSKSYNLRKKFWPTFRTKNQFHKLKLLEDIPVVSLVITGPRSDNWGYHIEDKGGYIDHQSYRSLKQEKESIS